MKGKVFVSTTGAIVFYLVIIDITDIRNPNSYIVESRRRTTHD
jgi:hypothetical protein